MADKTEKIISQEDKAAGERLRYVRVDILKIKSQGKFAEEMKFSQSAISAFELGIMEIGTRLLTSLHNKYGIMPNYILLGKKPIKDTPEKKSALLTDISTLRSEVAALTAKVEYISKRLK